MLREVVEMPDCPHCEMGCHDCGPGTPITGDGFAREHMRIARELWAKRKVDRAMREVGLAAESAVSSTCVRDAYALRDELQSEAYQRGIAGEWVR